jgi:hypothetical protein
MFVRVAGEVHFGVVARVGISEEARERLIGFAFRSVLASRGRARSHKTKVHYPADLSGANVWHDCYVPH